MKKTIHLKAAMLFAFAMLFTAVTFAQDKPVPSPRDSVSAKIGASTVTINYGSPAVKGRKVYGELVPFDKVWRAGANEATTFTTTKDIMVQGKKLPAGTYGFFVIPTATSWTIIFNKVAKQWGAYKYDEAQDALRVTAKAVKSKMSERLVYKINSKGFSLNWDTLSVPVMIK
ncbi:DUF2911 domain-containing protein [Mucilaginibacter phyllosphaerae]|uniref:DUF2911 domain-containing protein n=1 Tax=Mucilaginibacter phyllosphaerae TaxID=1812349 RepID=A0A4Y8AFP5_9SPHI|nr:DUF2911 domain-containing protein [Mucilaginibacter phyllosphaerae]MBB3968792.1 hypothetical protein [Mucilaginibacter phyllosphaerae]TEW67573.1 DUF2911 domain-containing protein [Mucilaginibacter phyllosphaerae]GGH13852.1 hypothetical protein GCM10007352_21590 [Mucilaginibacter phyllosphaerae]